MFLLLVSGLYAQDDASGGFAFHFSAEFLLGSISGSASELLYGAPSGAEFKSRLDWEMDHLYYYGVILSFNLDTPLRFLSSFVRLSLKNGVYRHTGFMEDRDWLDLRQTYLTHFSKHDNYTTGAILLDGDVGVVFRPWANHSWADSPGANRLWGEAGFLRFSVFFRVVWMKFTWESRDGYTQHASNSSYFQANGPKWTPDLPMTPVYGSAIDYSQNWLIFAPGFGIDLPLFKYFSLGAVFTISPFIRSTAEDHHHIGGDAERYDQYRDYPQGGLYTRPEVYVSFSPAEWITFTLHSSWTLIRGSRGQSYYTYDPDYTNWIYDGNSGGAGIKTWDLGFGIKISS